MRPAYKSKEALMRTFSVVVSLAVVAACATAPATQDAARHETVRLENSHGELRLIGGGPYADDVGYVFTIGHGNAGSELGRPTSVSWTVKFLDYCRDRPSWVQSVLIGPSGQTWRGYRVDVPAGPIRRQDWSTGSSGADRHGGPSTPGLLDAIAQGGTFTLALEDDTGVRRHSVVIDTLTPSRREALFQDLPAEDKQPQSPSPLIAVELAPLTSGAGSCLRD